MPEKEFRVIPAIDIMGGRCVRLRRGDFNQPSCYESSPLETAWDFAAAGFTCLHVVDLDGARNGKGANFNLVADICRRSECRVDVAGGIRTGDQVSRWLDTGAERVCVTTMAVRNPETLEQCVDRFGAQRFIVAADVRSGRVALNGWQQESVKNLPEFILTMRELGIQRFMSTAVDRDGMLAGPDFDLYQHILEKFPDIDLLASGGISRMSQVRRLRRMGLAGVVVGRALYEGRLDQRELAAEQAGREYDAGA